MFGKINRLAHGASAIAFVAAIVGFAGAASALTPEEESAVRVAEQWAKAVTARDIDQQMKLLPATMYAKDEDRERARLRKASEREVAIVRRAKYASFNLAPPSQTLKIGQSIAVVIPYKAVVESDDGKLQTDSSLIALSVDGRRWSVFDGTGHTLKSLRTVIPGYTGGLNVPNVRSVMLKSE